MDFDPRDYDSRDDDFRDRERDDEWREPGHRRDLGDGGDYRSDDHAYHRQEFHARLVKPRELEHDVQVYRAYLREAERLASRDEEPDGRSDHVDVEVLTIHYRGATWSCRREAGLQLLSRIERPNRRVRRRAMRWRASS